MAKFPTRPGEGGRGGRPRRPQPPAGERIGGRTDGWPDGWLDGWRVETRAGEPAELHALGLGDPIRRDVRLCRPTGAALVLGSTQPTPPPGPLPAALPVVRRRGGGGAVVVRPGALVWIDVVVPRDDPLWDDDVGRAFGWLGRVWARTLAGLGAPDVEVHDGGVVRTPWCPAVCYAGLGPGEVTVGGRKAVGMSQRRTRGGALFQCSLLRTWDPHAYVDALALPSEAAADLAEAAIAFPEWSVDEVEAAFLTNLRQ